MSCEVSTINYAKVDGSFSLLWHICFIQYVYKLLPCTYTLHLYPLSFSLTSFLLLLSLSFLFSLLYSSIVQYAFGVREERREVVGVVGSGLSIGLIRPAVV